MRMKIVKSVILTAMMGLAGSVIAQPQTIYDSQGRVITTVNTDGSTKTNVYGAKDMKSKTIDNNGKVTESSVTKDGNKVSPTK